MLYKKCTTHEYATVTNTLLGKAKNRLERIVYRIIRYISHRNNRRDDTIKTIFVILMHKILCIVGWHDYSLTNTISSCGGGGGSDLQGGKKCFYCRNQKITVKEARKKAEHTYKMGKLDIYHAMTGRNSKNFNPVDHGLVPKPLTRRD